jgi:hypothetical protein
MANRIKALGGKPGQQSNPNSRGRKADISVATNQDIVRQGAVQLGGPKDVTIPAATPGEQAARGFGAMLRPQKFTVS